MISDAVFDETKKQKAKRLRFTRPVVKGLSLDDIREGLFEMADRCAEAVWLADSDADVLTEALCGDEDDTYAFRMELCDLESEIERMQEDLRQAYVPELFDDFFVSASGARNELLGYDSYEEDYYGLDVYEYRYATEESRKRLERRTKKEILDTLAVCFNIYNSYLSLRYRYENLTAALDILRSGNAAEIRGAAALNDAYERYCSDGCREWSAEAAELDRIAAAMPAEAWLR